MIVKRSLTQSIAQALMAIVLLSFLTSGLALLTLHSSQRDAEAINLAGSLRMQSYRMAWDSFSDPSQMSRHLDVYQATLDSPVLRQLQGNWVPDEVKNRYTTLHEAWPELRRKLEQGDTAIYQQQVANYVSEIDRFVLGLQHYAELKMQIVALCCLAGFIAIVALALMTIRFTRQQVVKPLNALVTASRYVENGNFAFPSLPVAHENELGVLAHAFSNMAMRLQSHYQQLEKIVYERTQDLTQANRTLSLLNESSQMLTASPLNPSLFEKMLAMILTRETLTAIVLESEESQFAAGQPDDALAWQRLPLFQDEQPIGELRWQSSPLRPAGPLMISLANMLGRAVWIWQTQKHYQQMLLIEERATIARELHDSLAQALSFLRIQLTLLRRTVDPHHQAAQDIIGEFDRALSDAYRQLRELLGTFRLTIEQADLVAAMQAMIASLQKQVTAEITFDYQPGLQSLEPQQQVHVLQIAREALLNAIRHANARHIHLGYQRTANDAHRLTITDDGIGIASIDEPAGHYGLTTMTERTTRLSGSLSIIKRDQGTEVALCFPPRPAHPVE